MNKLHQAVILAAGESTRMHPLSITRPKALMKVANKTILEHLLTALKGLVEEVILVVGYKGKMIRDFFGIEFNNIKLSYVEQREQLGTGHALLQAKGATSGRFIMMYGDDLVSGRDIKEALKHKHAVLAKEVDDPERFGIFTLKGHMVKDIIEKPSNPESRLANTGVYVLDQGIFPLLERLEKSERGEYEIVDAIRLFASSNEVYCAMVSDYWLPIGYPWDLLDANSFLLERMRDKLSGGVEKGAFLKGEVCVGKDSVVKSGAYIEGPVMIGEHCNIGPNCYIRAHTTIGNNCHVGNAVEVKNSILFDHTNVAHLSYVGDSVLGEHVNFGAGTIVANLRHDNNNVRSMVKGILVDTGRRKLGTIVGDNVHTGIDTAIYPGRKIWPDKSTLPAEIVTKDKE